MIVIEMNQEKFLYDIEALLKGFYPQEKMVKIQSSGWLRAAKEEREQALKVWVQCEPNRVEILLKKEEKTVAGKTDGPFEEPMSFGEYKNRLKRALYLALSSYAGIQLDWGTLSGVRPTKIPMSFLEQGETEEEIRSHMKEEYLCSSEKIDLSIEIAERECRLLREMDYQNGYSIYIGIPFCPTTCAYCSFTSYPAGKHEKEMEPYLEALFREIEFSRDAISGKRLTTVYIGGGTPTALNDGLLERLLQKVRETYNFQQVKEFTVEAGRPDSLNAKKLQLLKEYGADRISINPQTMNDMTLGRIGRNHTTREIEEAFSMAREAGHDNINMDLIAGLPQETLHDFQDTMQKALFLAPESITIHSLVTKRAAKLRETAEAGGVLPGCVDDMTEEGMRAVRQHGYVPYYMYRQKNAQGNGCGANQENIGYAKPGKEGLYNILIMEEKQTILALGAGASSKFVFPEAGTGKSRIERVENVKNLKDYIERIDEMIERKRSFIAEEKGKECGIPSLSYGS